MHLMDLFLGLPYCTGDQQRFQKALDRGEIEEARDILEKLPHANINRLEEQVLRNYFLAIGYREIVRIVLPNVYGSETKKIVDEHKAYQQFGTPDEVEAIVEEYKKYKELGEVDELKRVVGADDRLAELETSLVRVPLI